ncbi:MAG: NrpR regulatory domain-containing protein [Methanobrevibacter sp.]|jgi:repressor of nif and glnA expression|nr:NrpR regulatory domain-containing protein [Candidatus Methanovirga meridionalis]
MSDSEHKMIEILRIINDHDKVVGSKKIANELQHRGFNLGERAVRYHLKILDERGFTERKGNTGRIITNLGEEELNKGLIYDHVDFIFSKSEEMIYYSFFDFNTNDGNVITCTSNFNYQEGLLETIKKGFQSGLAISPYVNYQKEKVGSEELIKINTVCATTFNGVLLSNGITSRPLYSGLLEVEDYMPKQFTQLISFKNTSISPLEAFSTNKMTSVGDVLEFGTGTIPAVFIVLPINSKEKALNLLEKLKKVGIGGVLNIGEDSEDALGIPVNEGMFGITIIGGVTPICLIYEEGYDVNIKLKEEIYGYKDLKLITNPKKTILKQGKYNINNKVQFILSKAWNLFEKVDFDVETYNGNLITNISIIKKEDLDNSIEIMYDAYKNLSEYISPYYKMVDNVGDSNEIGIATICSLSLDGILINNGILSTPKYGGLLEIKSNPQFIELIAYSGSSLDPHVIYIFKDLTAISKNKEGNRKLLSSVKEIPVVAREDTENLLSIIKDIGIPVYKIGKPRELVYNTKIDAYNFAIVTGSGLNTIAAIKEENIDVKVKAVESLEKLSNMETLK